MVLKSTEYITHIYNCPGQYKLQLINSYIDGTEMVVFYLNSIFNFYIVPNCPFCSSSSDSVSVAGNGIEILLKVLTCGILCIFVNNFSL